MQPVTDLHFLAEASPRASPALIKADPVIPPSDPSEFVETTVRCMGYRSFVRWYHGSFSAAARVSKLILNYALALLTLVALYAFMCITVTTDGVTTEDSTILGLPIWLAISCGASALVTMAICLACEQTSRIAPISIWLSRVTLIAVFLASFIQFVHYVHFEGGRPTFEECPTVYPSFVFPITLVMLVGLQVLLALIAASIQLLAIPLGRWYLLKSNMYKARWSVSIIDIHRSTVTIMACPYKGCQGEWNFSKRLAALIHLVAHGRRVVFSPVEGYLPQDISVHLADVKPCCPFACVYVGQVDHRLRPHGTGVWQQGWGARFGEYLSGTWEFGRPIAPFMSRQNVCGSGFTALRFGWVKFDFTTQESIDQVYKAKKSNVDDDRLEESNFEFGLLDVECSVFGSFFRRFPKFVYWKFPSNAAVKMSMTPRGDDSESNASGSAVAQLRRRASRLKPALGLNNRMSSFSYLEAEPAARSSFLSAQQPAMQPPLSPRRNTFITEAKESFSFASRMLAHKASVDRRRSSNRSQSNSKCRTLGGRQESQRTFEDCYVRIKWVVDNMLPFHIPICAGEDQEQTTLKITLDPSRGLCPSGWYPNASNRTSWRATRMSKVAESPRHSRTWCGGQSPCSSQSSESWLVSSLHVELSETRRPKQNPPGTGVPSSPMHNPTVSPMDHLEVAVAGWRKVETDLEAMIFIHGYKTPLEEAPLLLGQLIALGGFPNRIKPFMFLWPAGVKMWHYYQARRASEHYLCQKALIFFLKTLVTRGIRRVHILAHSMGSRLFLNALKYAEQENLFVSNSAKKRLAVEGPPVTAGEGQLDLVNLVFLHPEHYLEDFVDGGGYDACRKIATLISVYCHANDEALASAEILSRGQRCMGRHPFGFVRMFSPRPRKPASILKKPSPLRTSSPRSFSPDIPKLTTTAASPTVRRVADFNTFRPSSGSSSPRDSDFGRDFGSREFGNFGSREFGSREGYGSPRSRSGEVKPQEDRFKIKTVDPPSSWEWLDLDVIDCTFLDANVHGLRHCFFNINASVVGDLRELLSERNRAAQRHQTLERRDGNVYTFRTPPAELSSIFGV